MSKSKITAHNFHFLLSTRRRRRRRRRRTLWNVLILHIFGECIFCVVHARSIEDARFAKLCARGGICDHRYSGGQSSERQAAKIYVLMTTRCSEKKEWHVTREWRFFFVGLNNFGYENGDDIAETHLPNSLLNWNNWQKSAIYSFCIHCDGFCGTNERCRRQCEWPLIFCCPWILLYTQGMLSNVRRRRRRAWHQTVSVLTQLMCILMCALLKFFEYIFFQMRGWIQKNLSIL